ncbi:MAG: NUDIX hydrolase [Chitinophagales bacterium]|nr:NUDIX hydrolase [Chitinophagales bacterium]
MNKAKATILLIRQFRLPVFLHGHDTGFILECCAGLLDEDNPEAAIIREIEEETGYRLNTVTKVCEAFATPGAHKEKIHYYYGYYDATMHINKGGGLISEQEDIELVEYPISEIQQLLDNGVIIDAKTIVLLQWALLNQDKLVES